MLRKAKLHPAKIKLLGGADEVPTWDSHVMDHLNYQDAYEGEQDELDYMAYSVATIDDVDTANEIANALDLTFDPASPNEDPLGVWDDLIQALARANIPTWRITGLPAGQYDLGVLGDEFGFIFSAGQEGVDVLRDHLHNYVDDDDEYRGAAVKPTPKETPMNPHTKVRKLRSLLRKAKSELRRAGVQRAGQQVGHRTADNFQRDDFQEFFDSYLETALWSSHDESDESGGNPMDQNFTLDDIADECLAVMWKDCQKFFNQNYETVEAAEFSYGPDYGPWGHVGHDFWLTRNGHGAGFWDGDYSGDAGEILTEASEQFGEQDLYVHDGHIYCQ